MIRCRPASFLRVPAVLSIDRGRALAGTLGAALLLLLPAPVRAVEEIYVADLNNVRVNVFGRTASGDVVPLRSLQGPSTGLSNPAGIAVDEVHGELFVTNSNVGRITVYPLTADGDVAPLRTLQGAATGLTNPNGIVVDPAHDEIFVGDYDNGVGVKVFSRTASGNTAPLRTLSSVNRVTYLALDPLHGELIVSATWAGVVSVYDRGASGAAAPLRSFYGSLTGINEPHGIAVDLANDELAVGDFYNGSVRVFARTVNGNVPPLRVLQGPLTTLSGPQGIAVDPLHGEIFVTNYWGGTSFSMLVFDRAANGNVAPLRTVAGPTTGLFRPTDVKVIAHAISADGFESGDTAGWSGTTG